MAEKFESIRDLVLKAAESYEKAHGLAHYKGTPEYSTACRNGDMLEAIYHQNQAIIQMLFPYLGDE